MSWEVYCKLPTSPGWWPKLQFHDGNDRKSIFINKELLTKNDSGDDQDDVYCMEVNLDTKECIKHRVYDTDDPLSLVRMNYKEDDAQHEQKEKEEDNTEHLSGDNPLGMNHKEDYAQQIQQEQHITVPSSDHDESDEIMSKSGYKNVGFDDKKALYFAKPNDPDTWYKVLLPYSNDNDGDCHDFTVIEPQYVVIFGVRRDGDDTRDIMICDMMNLKLYTCEISLPVSLVFMSSIVIPQLDETKVLYVLEYWVRTNCLPNTIELFANDLSSLITRYYPNASYLYMIGGSYTDAGDSDPPSDHNLGNEVWRIDIKYLLNNKRLHTNIEETIHVDDISFTDPHDFTLPTCLIC
eukprot:699132_1